MASRSDAATDRPWSRLAPLLLLAARFLGRSGASRDHAASAATEPRPPASPHSRIAAGEGQSRSTGDNRPLIQVATRLE
ncbi:hypothetical protein LA76x_3760 [Lysobacter antibioticus]|uniref:Uncharacterized protein n=1 Tax=Lysobacter antibioticus TaxID=84531 RepID=A0A0S2FEC4_LYSAN|nr:hypothetical protein LA76x_3760 [Lysobacter antibioticus]